MQSLSLLPWAVVVSVLIQSGMVLLWIGRAAARLDMVERRMGEQAGVVERLARLEEQALAGRAALERIEAKLALEL